MTPDKYNLLVVTRPLGIVSMLLSHWRSRDEARRLHDQTALIPFGSVSELLSLRRKVRNFAKARYPARLGSRQIRGPVGAAAMWLHFGVVSGSSARRSHWRSRCCRNRSTGGKWQGRNLTPERRLSSQNAFARSARGSPR
jgi:hypothetical protein